MENPFRYGGIVLGPYFADRKNEMEELKNEIRNFGRVFLVSPRRYGKTCLLFNLIESLKIDEAPVAYLDLNAYPDVKSLAAGYTLQTCKALETNRDKLVKILSSLKNFMPQFSVESDGTKLSVSLISTLQEKDALAALLESMQYADRLANRTRKNLVIIIDEFAELAKYNGDTLEKALRSEIQKHQNIAYIFSGSEQSVMLAMLKDPKRAFYKLGRIMELGPIDRKSYKKFIMKWFKKGNIVVSTADLQRIFELGNDVPYNIQRLCNNMWHLTQKKNSATSTIIERLPAIIAKQDSPHYELFWRTASLLQRKILIALSRDPDSKPLSKDFALRYQISPPSSIRASLISLIKKGIIYQTLEGSYQFSDTFMPYWIDSIT